MNPDTSNPQVCVLLLIDSIEGLLKVHGKELKRGGLDLVTCECLECVNARGIVLAARHMARELGWVVTPAPKAASSRHEFSGRDRLCKLCNLAPYDAIHQIRRRPAMPSFAQPEITGPLAFPFELLASEVSAINKAAEVDALFIDAHFNTDLAWRELLMLRELDQTCVAPEAGNPLGFIGKKTVLVEVNLLDGGGSAGA